MGLGQKRNQLAVPEANKAMEQFKYEVASQLGINPPASGYWGNYTSRDCGAVGGNMVKRMIEQVEQDLANRSGANLSPSGFATSGIPGGNLGNYNNNFNINMGNNNLGGSLGGSTNIMAGTNIPVRRS